MSAIAAKFSNASINFKVGAAAVAVAAAATLSPAIAEAAPVQLPAPASPVEQVMSGGLILGPAYIALDTPDVTVNAAAITDFTPLGWIQGVVQNVGGWFRNVVVNGATAVGNAVSGAYNAVYTFAANLNIQGCVFGTTVKIGPYGHVSTSSGC